jgi:hypothetical protein
MPREARDGRSGDVQEVLAENRSCIFCTPAIPGGRMPRSPSGAGSYMIVAFTTIEAKLTLGYMDIFS